MKQHKITRWLATSAVLLGLGVAAPIATAGPAAAGGYGCDGTLVDTLPHYAYSFEGGGQVATTYIYWDGTYNCVVNVKQGSTYGVSTRMALSIMTSTEMNGDPGYFKYYAGPVKIYAKGRCIKTEATGWGTNGHELYQNETGWMHCG
ncbi:hypothetical protein ABZ318_22730 [Streptomyces sp. NPDC006197]|uniref:hypothetical protein n=1 Tax=Streptomyces sp. NPDC006197 TaxID=3156685 RepID=UPI0033A1D669